jgi:transcriptional regulator with XRE-family HTH domain
MNASIKTQCALVCRTLVYDSDMSGRPTTREAPPFGQRLAAIRKKKGWSQTEFAKRLNVTRNLIDYYERRAVNPTLEFMRQAAEALEVSVAELVGDEIKVVALRPGPAPKLLRQIDELRRLPRAKQRFVSEFLDTVLQKTSAS